MRKTTKSAKASNVTLDVVLAQINEAATDFENGDVLAGVAIVGNIVAEVSGTLHNSCPCPTPDAPTAQHAALAACPVPTDCQAGLNRLKNSAARCCQTEGMKSSLFGLNIDPAAIQNAIQLIETLLPLFINAAKVAA